MAAVTVDCSCLWSALKDVQDLTSLQGLDGRLEFVIGEDLRSIRDYASEFINAEAIAMGLVLRYSSAELERYAR